ncbi:hypothetical protein BSU04_02415 [Caballeronia sordidicola]|uniref:Uncharacterized protein n=1 Tax=Caballeronia sordidicola TaxID=196367 RepID=A0A226XB34_CABSO|nr:hypothetical protein BSU04_02415 [Caballeronia sordidicola]
MGRAGDKTRAALPSSWCVAETVATMENANAARSFAKRQADTVPGT